VKTLFENFNKDVKVLIVDLNFQDGGSDLSFALDLPVLPHIGMWLRERIKESFFENLIEYSPNVFILQSPPKVSLVKDISGNDIDTIVKFARSKFDVIIFDLPDEFNEIVKAALDNASKIIVLSQGTKGELARMKEFPYEYLTLFIKPEKGFGKYAKMLNLKLIEHHRRRHTPQRSCFFYIFGSFLVSIFKICLPLLRLYACSVSG
jgi:cellulose biosynthesis protein BcsQ